MDSKYKSSMIDNRKVNDDHGRKGKITNDPTAAIKRVMQEGCDRLDYAGHNGSMKDGWKHGKSSQGSSSFKRDGISKTPSKA